MKSVEQVRRQDVDEISAHGNGTGTLANRRTPTWLYIAGLVCGQTGRRGHICSLGRYRRRGCSRVFLRRKPSATGEQKPCQEKGARACVLHPFRIHDKLLFSVNSRTKAKGLFITLCSRTFISGTSIADTSWCTKLALSCGEHLDGSVS